MRFNKNDTPITTLAKKAAMISVYAIRNPFHVSFEDRNFYPEWDLNFERQCNEKRREENGELMYQFIKSFIDELEAIDGDSRMAVYRLFRKKRDYLYGRWDRTICKISQVPYNPNRCVSWDQYPADNGHIYAETCVGVKGVKMLMF